MKEYRKVVEFSFNNNKYNMYLDNNNKRFYLRVTDDGYLSYITIEELFDLIKHFEAIPNVMNISRDSPNEKFKFYPMIIMGGVTAILTLSIISVGLSIYNSNQTVNEFEKKSTVSELLSKEIVKDHVLYDYTNEIEKAKKNIQDRAEIQEGLAVDTYQEIDKRNIIYIYDMEYIDKAFEKEDITLDMLYQAVDSNPSISEKFKGIIYEYCDSVVRNYPDIELRVLYENLKTLEIVECDEYELSKKTSTINASGCYIRNENKIYVLETKEYEKETWDYQVIYHELSHCLRTGDYDIDGKNVKVQIEGQNFNNKITVEALNSLFAVSLFDYEEDQIAYQLQSNYNKVILDCIDNYNLSDYVNHSLSYYAHQLDEFNGDENYATVILELIQMQYDDYHSESINVDPTEYYPIYDYICKMYFNKYITSDMSYDEAKYVTDQLIEKTFYGVPEDYNIDINRFYDNLNEYYYSDNISVKVKTR